MWKIVLLKWDSFVLSMGSIVYGIQLYSQPSILENYRVYDLIRRIFDNRIIGFLFIAFGLLKLVGLWKNNKLVKKVALRGLLFLWLLFMIAFIITPPPNTVWIMALICFALGLGIVVREE